jgi:hypothetical protein
VKIHATNLINKPIPQTAMHRIERDIRETNLVVIPSAISGMRSIETYKKYVIAY